MKNLQNNLKNNNIVTTLDNTPELHAVPVSQITSDAQFLHELRNPLNNIDLCVSMLKEAISPLDAERFLDIISHSTLVINSIINNKIMLLKDDVSKCSINTVLDDALEMTQDRITLRNIKVEKNYSDNINELLLDAAGIKIVFINIIINAIEAIISSNGKITLTTKVYNNKCIVIIEDNGVGINEENQKKLFDPYYTSKPGGMGLGLATTQAVLKINHASIKVESVVNEGTRFIIFFDI